MKKKKKVVFLTVLHFTFFIYFTYKGIWLSLSAEGEIHVGEVEQKKIPFGIMSATAKVSAHSIFTVPDTVKCYLLTELPVMYHAAYRLLEKAVETLRSKTAKVLPLILLTLH